VSGSVLFHLIWNSRR